VTGNFSVSSVVGAWKEFRSIGISNTLRTLTNAGVSSGFMRERETYRENSGALKRRRWWGTGSWTERRARADVDSWPGSDGELICHSGCMEVCSEVGEYIIHPLSWARRVKQTGRRRRERSGTRYGDAMRKSGGERE